MIKSCNYQINGSLMDVTYFQQPIAMLKNLQLINEENQLTDYAYVFLGKLSIFKEIGTDIDNLEKIFDEFEMEQLYQIIKNENILEEIPAPDRKICKAKVEKSNSNIKKSRHHDFEKEGQKRTKIGMLGEKLVLDFERMKAEMANIENIPDKVFLTSENDEYGNAYPCDIISLDIETGEQIFIEVKTTTGNIDTPFIISETERKFSEKYKGKYYLYRVYEALKTPTPKFYRTSGYVEDNFTLISDGYIATRDIIEIKE